MTLSLKATGADGFYRSNDAFLDLKNKKSPKSRTVIRFEVPYKIWCEYCSAILDKGYRCNANKILVGNYLTTRIYEFKFPCFQCKNELRIRTNPKECSYDCVKGCKRKVESYSATDIGVSESPTMQYRAQLKSDPMLQLEVKSLDTEIKKKDQNSPTSNGDRNSEAQDPIQILWNYRKSKIKDRSLDQLEIAEFPPKREDVVIASKFKSSQDNRYLSLLSKSKRKI